MVAWLVGWRLGWEEFLLVAGGCLLAVAVALLFTIGRSDVDADVELTPPRVVVGEQAVGRVEVRNGRGHRMLPVRLDVPVGTGLATFSVPSLAPGSTWDELFIIPTVRRSIMAIGPVSAVRGDPLGLARRMAPLTDPLELYVHPRTVRLAGLTSGWIRDLEGRPTNDLSPSDIAFHTLREYVPGDDRRHIHWRTSARLGTLMVRQFVDSRRSQLGLVLSTVADHYATDDEFETAVSVVASLGVAALQEDQEAAVTTGARPLPAHAPTTLLDTLSGVEPVERGSLDDLVRRATPVVRDASVIVVVCGSGVDRGALRAAAERFPHDSTVLAVRVDPTSEASVQVIGSTTIVDLATLDDLARTIRTTVSR